LVRIDSGHPHGRNGYVGLVAILVDRSGL
jgi:hypothetical protein